MNLKDDETWHLFLSYTVLTMLIGHFCAAMGRARSLLRTWLCGVTH